MPSQAPGRVVDAPQGESPQYTKPAPEQRETYSVSAQVFKEAQAQLERGEWRKAVQVAERGLRIDRHNAQMYWILSHCYAEMGEDERSLSFAQQGLSFVGKDNWSLERRLKALASE